MVAVALHRLLQQVPQNVRAPLTQDRQRLWKEEKTDSELFGGAGGAALHRGSIFAFYPAALGSILSISRFFHRKNVVEVNQRRWLEESGQWLENVDLTQLGASQ